MKRLAGLPVWLAARPGIAALTLLALTLSALLGASNLRTEIDFFGLLDPRSEAAQAMAGYQARFGPLGGDEVLLIEGADLNTTAGLTALEDLIIELHFADGVDQVFSLFSLPGPGMASAWLSSPQAQALDPAERLTRLTQIMPLAAQLLTEDRQATLLAVLPEPDMPRDALLSALTRAAGEAAPSLRLTPAGLPQVHAAIGNGLLRDLRVLTPVAVLACAALTLLMFGNASAVVICALPPIATLLWFFGWLGARGITLDPIMGSLPVVLIVLSFSQAMHLYFAALRLAQTGKPPARAATMALAETMPAMVLTTLTTMIAFTAIALQGAPQLTKMALAGIAGMGLALLAGLIMVPLLIRLLAAPRQHDPTPPGLGPVVTLARRLSRRVRLVPALTALLMVVLMILQSGSQTGFHYAEYLPTNAPVTRTLDRMEAMGLGSDRLFLVVETAPAMAPNATPPGFPAGLANLHAAAAVLWGDAPGWQPGLLALVESGRISAADGGAHALPVQLPIATGSTAADQALRQTQAALAGAGLADVTRLVGANQALLSEGPVLVQKLRFGLYATILSITLLIALVFRSWRIGLVALVPNLIPILGVEAWMVLAGRDLSIMTMIALTVAFGIAVDDTVHLLNRYRLAAGLPHGDRVDRALRDAGPPIVATTAVLLTGFAVMLTSAIPGAVLFGGLVALSVLLALLADMFILPGLMRWGVR